MSTVQSTRSIMAIGYLLVNSRLATIGRHDVDNLLHDSRVPAGVHRSVLSQQIRVVVDGNLQDVGSG